MSTAGHLRVGIFVFDDAEELDVVGPFEVFTAWAAHSAMRPAVVHVLLRRRRRAAREGAADPARARRGRRRPAARARLPGRPGHPAARWATRSTSVAAGQRRRVPLMTSVCTGALSSPPRGCWPAAPATTHWTAFDELADLDPSVLVDTEARFVDDGDVITSAGVSAGIDMALHLVARLETRTWPARSAARSSTTRRPRYDGRIARAGA